MDVEHPVIHLSLPKWKSEPITMYPGNFFAHKLKEIHDDSRSVFPESVYSTASQARNRWTSLTKIDYLPMEQLREKALQKEKERARKATVSDVFVFLLVVISSDHLGPKNRLYF